MLVATHLVRRHLWWIPRSLICEKMIESQNIIIRPNIHHVSMYTYIGRMLHQNTFTRNICCMPQTHNTEHRTLTHTANKQWHAPAETHNSIHSRQDIFRYRNDTSCMLTCIGMPLPIY